MSDETPNGEPDIAAQRQAIRRARVVTVTTGLGGGPQARISKTTAYDLIRTHGPEITVRVFSTGHVALDPRDYGEVLGVPQFFGPPVETIP